MAIEVSTQQELDKALAKTNNGADELIVCVGAGRFVVAGSSSVVARGSSSVVAWGSSSVVAWGSSSVEAWESSSVEAWESSSVVAWESSSVVAWGSSSVEAWESSSVVAWESSSVEAWESSSVVAWESSSVVARGSSSVVAWESSSVVAWESSSVRAFSGRSTIKAAKHAVVMQHNPDAKVSGGRILEMPRPETGAEWCEFYGVEVRKGGGLSRKLKGQDVAILFKALGRGYESSRGMSYEPGSMPEAPDWDGGAQECGRGLHFSPHPKMAREFNRTASHYVACPVLLSEIVVHPDGRMPQKVKAPRVVAPCWEVDVNGERLPGDGG